MYPLTLGVAIETKELRDEVESGLRDLPARIVVEEPDPASLGGFLERIDQAKPDVILVGISKLRDPLGELVQKLQARTPEAMIIAVENSADPASILDAFRAGVDEYLFPPFEDNLRKALERKSSERGRARDGSRQGGKTVGFFSAKGGCGSTTIACHVAVELGLQSQKVLLADLDLEAGMVGFLMKTKSPYSVLDAMNNLHRLDRSYWKALVSNGLPGVEIISAPTALGLRQPPQPEQLHYLLSFVRTQYDWTLVDLGRGLNPLTISALEEMDETCLVTSTEVPALHQAKLVVRTLLDSGYGKERVRLIVNRAPKRLDVTLDELEKVLGLPVYSLVPNNYPELYECYSEGRLLYRSSHMGQSIASLALKLAGLQEQKRKRKFPLFG